MKSIFAIKISCTNGSTYSMAGSYRSGTNGKDPQGTWQPALVCPSGYVAAGITGRKDTYVQSLGLVCKTP